VVLECHTDKIALPEMAECSGARAFYLRQAEAGCWGREVYRLRHRHYRRRRRYAALRPRRNLLKQGATPTRNGALIE
jgi:hypothetical protein